MKHILDFSNENILKDELKNGNHLALDYLMSTYHLSLCAYVHNLSNDYEASKDIVQNVFIKVWEDRINIHNIKSIKSFLYKSVYNRFIDQWRKDKRMLSLEMKHLEALNYIVEYDNQDVILKQVEMINLEIKKLPKKCRTIFLLSKQEGLTNIEISEFLGISLRTVESHINKAFRRLRKALKHKIKTVFFLLFKQNLTSFSN